MKMLGVSNPLSFEKKKRRRSHGFKIGCVSKETQDKMGLTKPAWGRLWKSEKSVN